MTAAAPRKRCSTAFGAASGESTVKSTSSARDSCGGMPVPSAGAEGSRRSRLQSPYTQSGATRAVPEYDASTRVGSAASTTSTRSTVAGTRAALVSSRS